MQQGKQVFCFTVYHFVKQMLKCSGFGGFGLDFFFLSVKLFFFFFKMFKKMQG